MKAHIMAGNWVVAEVLTGSGELSFRWIQICIGSPMH